MEYVSCDGMQEEQSVRDNALQTLFINSVLRTLFHSFLGALKRPVVKQQVTRAVPACVKQSSSGFGGVVFSGNGKTAAKCGDHFCVITAHIMAGILHSNSVGDLLWRLAVGI